MVSSMNVTYLVRSGTMSEILNPGPSRESQGPSPSGTLFRTRREVADLFDRGHRLAIRGNRAHCHDVQSMISCTRRLR